jgi:hypothetical protein
MATRTISRATIEVLIPEITITAPVAMTASLARVTRNYQVDTDTQAETEYGAPRVEYLYGETVASLTTAIQAEQARLQARIDALDDEIEALEAL